MRVTDRDSTASDPTGFVPDDPVEAVLMPGGAVVLDETGRVRLGLSDESLAELVGDAPDFVRLAVAHLAGIQAAQVGLLEPSGHAEEEHLVGAGVPSEGVVARDLRVSVIRSGAFLSLELLNDGLSARERGRAALPLVQSGGRSYVGPLLAPDADPCICCVGRAVAPNRKSEQLRFTSVREPRRSAVTDSRAVRLIRERSPSPSSEILEIDDRGRLVGRHHVRSFPDCEICGADEVDPTAVCPELESRPKHVRTDTGARGEDPARTYARYRHLISPVSGAVRRVRRVDMGAPNLLHVYTASHAMSDKADSFTALMRDGRDPSGGKGSTAEQARVSALCEALERFTAVSTGNEIDAVGELADVKGSIHPADFLLFSERQYEAREAWNPGQSRFQYVPEPFDEREAIAWSRVWCLQTGERAYLPSAMLYFAFDGPGSEYGQASSNGLAAGQNAEEAILHGFLELVERDAIALWWYNRLRVPGLDVASFDDPYVNDVFTHYDDLGRRAWVLDLTSDLGIPVFAAISARREASRPEVIFGFGAHLDPSIALRRCVTEMNQMLATVLRPDDERRAQLSGTFDDALRWWEGATLEENPYVVPDVDSGSRGRECFDDRSSADVRDDIHACLDTATRYDLAVYVRDMTRGDLGIPVVKVVVPGLRHFWRRLAPGRLYDVPVSMGRLDAPMPEEDMNPVSFFV